MIMVSRSLLLQNNLIATNEFLRSAFSSYPSFHVIPLGMAPLLDDLALLGMRRPLVTDSAANNNRRRLANLVTLSMATGLPSAAHWLACPILAAMAHGAWKWSDSRERIPRMDPVAMLMR